MRYQGRREKTMLEELVSAASAQAIRLRHDIHAHPELAFAEERTADLVAARLQALGIEVHRGLAGTGVIGKISAGTSPRAIGLRADLDALPLDELNTFAHRSCHDGKMHACGHDGHTAMLLGAAEVLQKTRAFDGTVYLIFQPAEEHEGGGRVMVEQGLFERFPMQMVFGLHNWPELPPGEIGVMAGPMMAATDRFDITLTGRGGHAAMPHMAVDSVVAAAALIQALQTLVSRNTAPKDAAVVSVTRVHGGHADNIIPESVVLGGTVRSLTAAMRDMLEAGMRRVCTGIEAAYGVKLELSYLRGYPPVINAAAPTQLCIAAARDVAGAAKVHTDLSPSMCAEDFSYLSEAVPGCYIWLGTGLGRNDCGLHSPHYDFNDAVIPLGIRYWVTLTQQVLPAHRN